MLIKRSAAALLTAAAVAVSVIAQGYICAKADDAAIENTEVDRVREIVIDGSTADTAQNSVWRGFGFVSANNSSRLLLDYRERQPEQYHKLLELLFDPAGPVKMTHIKLEMGADINSSSGTEPSTKRSADEPADVTRGAGFRLAADALAINPDITLELLSWGAPGYIKNATDRDEQYRLRYQWFKETLDAAYETYGLEFQYIAPSYNEKLPDTEFIKYFSEALKSEKDTPYPYDEIKISAADENTTYNLPARMLNDKELLDAVDVIGIHYTSTSDENTLKCKNEYGKELWYSEGVAPAVTEKYAVNADGSGLGGVNGVLDVAGRIINMYPNGGFTLYEIQPPVSAYYGGVNYYPKQLITANEPWSGYMETGAGVYMCAHFMMFSEPGWQFVKSGCFGDGREDNHVLYDTTSNILTLTDPDTGDYSMILSNNTASSRSYSFTVKNLKKASSQVKVWETRGPDEGEEYDANYLKNIMSAEPEETEDGYKYSLTLKPYSLVTVTTLDVSAPTISLDEAEQTRLELPYTDDFEYADTDENYLSSRGGAPRYTTDQGGAFEVIQTEDGSRVLQQKITEDMRGVEWGMSPPPVTTLGDDTWANYTVSAKVKLEMPQELNGRKPEDIYAGIGLRYINASASASKSGYHLLINAAGSWQLLRMSDVLAEGKIDRFSPYEQYELSVTAMGDNLSAAINGVRVASLMLTGEVTFSGRAALFSSYDLNTFDDLAVIPADMTSYITRVDDLDEKITYSGDWQHSAMDPFTCHNRTASTAVAFPSDPQSFTFSFEGDSLALIGKATDDASISVDIDGTLTADKEPVGAVHDKSAFWHRYSLGYGEHDVTVTVNSGKITLDALEYGSDTVLTNGGTDLGLTSEKNNESLTEPADKPDKGRNRKSFGLTIATAAAAAAALLAVFKIIKKRKSS